MEGDDAAYALWPTRANYARYKELMEDGHIFPPTFNEWEKHALRKEAEAKFLGIDITRVPFDSIEFVAFCRMMGGLKHWKDTRALYAICSARQRSLAKR